MSAQSHHKADPRWFALVNDRIYTAPRHEIPVSLLRALASVPADLALIRDHQSPNDEPLADGASVDLSQGNVFFTKPRAEVGATGPCGAPPKMALAVDDRFELTTIAEIKVADLLSLFNLPNETTLVRDLESPDDQILEAGGTIRFGDGPTFLTRSTAPNHIDVSVVTTSGTFPEEGFERLPIHQPLKVQLARAAKALKLTDVSDWIARLGTRELDIEKSYASNGLSGKVEIDYGKREGGGGAK